MAVFWPTTYLKASDTNFTYQLRRLDTKESFENIEILSIFRSFKAVIETSGWIIGRNDSQRLYQTSVAETCQLKCHQTQYFAYLSLNDHLF
jgi:hypothetical protein